MHLPFAAIDAFTSLAQIAVEPQIDGPFIARVASRIIHILFAIILGGGLFYMRSVLSPSGAAACFADRRSVWARWVGVATFLLLASGLYNYVTIVRTAKDAGAAMPTSYHMLFGIKFLLALVVFFIAAILAGRTSTADRFRASMSRWLKIAWTAVMAIVIIGALLRTFHS
jgi:hypothetical protein